MFPGLLKTSFCFPSRSFLKTLEKNSLFLAISFCDGTLMVMELGSPHPPVCLEPGNESDTFSELESCRPTVKV